MGCNPHTFGGRLPSARSTDPPLQDTRPKVENKLARGGVEEGRSRPGQISRRESSPRIRATFRIFSPDELMSNKLGGVFEAPTARDYQWPIEGGDRAEHVGPHGGRVLEILCRAHLSGVAARLLTHRPARSFPALRGVSDHHHFHDGSVRQVPQNQREIPLAAAGVLAQLPGNDHALAAGAQRFRHQSPGFINSHAQQKEGHHARLSAARRKLPALDDGPLPARGEHVNLVIANKAPMPTWLTWRKPSRIAVRAPRSGRGRARMRCRT